MGDDLTKDKVAEADAIEFLRDYIVPHDGDAGLALDYIEEVLSVLRARAEKAEKERDEAEAHAHPYQRSWSLLEEVQSERDEARTRLEKAEAERDEATTALALSKCLSERLVVQRDDLNAALAKSDAERDQLRAEVERLLAAHEAVCTFLEFEGPCEIADKGEGYCDEPTCAYCRMARAADEVGS